MPDLFIERVVELDGEHPLPLRFFRPESAGDDFACLYEVEWPHGLVVRSVYGVDAVQALILAQRSPTWSCSTRQRANRVA